MSKKKYVEEKYSTRQEWLEHRGIGGSSSAMVINKSKWGSAVDVYNSCIDALDGKPYKEKKKNSRMEEGTKAEDLIRQLFSLEHPELKVTAPPKRKYWMFRRMDYPLLTLTPDGLVKDLNTKMLFGLEIKDVELIKREDKDNWLSGKLPNKYYCQGLHYMIVINDLDGVIFVARLKFMIKDDLLDKWVLDHTEDRVFWLYRKDVVTDIKWLESKEIDLIENNILKRKKPATIISF